MSKYILVLKMPSGRGGVLVKREGDGVAVIPVEDNLLMVKDIFAFNEIVDAQLWIRGRIKENHALEDFYNAVTILRSDETFVEKGI